MTRPRWGFEDLGCILIGDLDVGGIQDVDLKYSGGFRMRDADWWIQDARLGLGFTPLGCRIQDSGCKAGIGIQTSKMQDSQPASLNLDTQLLVLTGHRQ